MSNALIVKEFLLAIRSTSTFRGNPFVWDPIAKHFKSRKDWYFVFTRFILNGWSFWALVHKTYWWNYGRVHKDQTVTEEMLDNLYFGAAVLCNSLHLGLRIQEKSILAFMNSLMTLNHRNEQLLKMESRNATEKKFNWRYWLTVYIVILTVENSSAAALILFKHPGHRRYTYNAITQVTEDSWIIYPVFILHWIRMMHHWGVLFLYTSLGSFYCRITQHWVQQLTFDPSSSLSEQIQRPRLLKSIREFRILQYMNNYFNSTFGTINAIMYSCLWANLLYYFVMVIIGIGRVPLPEYFVFPLVAFGATSFTFVIIKEMAEVLTCSTDFIRCWTNVVAKGKKGKSQTMLRTLRVNMAEFFHIVEDACILFLAAVVDSVVNILVAVF